MFNKKNKKTQLVQKEDEVIKTHKELFAVLTSGADQSSKVTVNLKDTGKFEEIKSLISENIGRDYVVVIDDIGAVNLRFYSRVYFYFEDVKEGK